MDWSRIEDIDFSQLPTQPGGDELSDIDLTGLPNKGKDLGFMDQIGPALKLGTAQTVRALGSGVEAQGINLQSYLHPELKTIEGRERRQIEAEKARDEATLSTAYVQQISSLMDQIQPGETIDLTEPTPTDDETKPGAARQEKLQDLETFYGEYGLPSSTAPGKAMIEAGRSVAQTGAEVIAEHPEWQRPPELQRNWRDLIKDPDMRMGYLARALGENIPNMAASLGLGAAVGVATKSPAAAMATAMTFTNVLETGFSFEELRRITGSDAEAAEVAGMVGFVNALLEAAPVAVLFKKNPLVKKAFRQSITQSLVDNPMWLRVLRNGIEQAATEGSTEALQEVVGNLGKRFFDENQQLLEGTGESAFIGSLLGVMAGAPGGIVSGGPTVTADQVTEQLTSKLPPLVQDPGVATDLESGLKWLYQEKRPLGESAKRFEEALFNVFSQRFNDATARDAAAVNAALLEARARTWAVIMGKHPEDWWKRWDPTPVADTAIPKRPPESMTIKDKPVPYDIMGMAWRSAQKHRVDPRLLVAMAKVESNFDPKAVSDAGAQGLMQFMPETATQMGLKNPLDAAESMDAGAKYIKSLLDRYDGNVEKALAAYNAGPGRVDEAGGIPEIAETQAFVREVLSGFREAKGQRGDVIYNAAQATTNDGSIDLDLIPSKPDADRGQVGFGANGRTIIRFFEEADLSTAPHEIYHIFRRDMEEMALSQDSPQWVKNDWAAANEFVGAKVGDVWTVEQEEKFAEAGIRYLAEGVAPTPELRGIFNSLRQWLLRIYKHLAYAGVPVSDEMRRVFDRMLATEDEIQRAQHLTSTIPMLEAESTNQKVMDQYLELANKASQEVDAKIRKKRERDIKSQMTIWRSAAREYAAAHPAQEVLDKIKENGGINLDSVREDYSENVIQELKSRLKTRFKQYFKEDGGLGLDEMADIVGMEDGDTLINFLLGAPSKKELVDQYLKDAEADYHEQTDSETDGVDSEAYIAMLELEVKELSKQLNKRPPRSSTDIQRVIAKKVGLKRSGEVTEEYAALKERLRSMARAARSAYREATRVERAAGKEKAKQAKEKLLEKALAAKQQQRMAALELREYKKAREEFKRAGGYFKRVSKSKGIASDYRDRIQEILSKIDPNFRSKKTLEKRENFREWYRKQVEADAVMDLPDKVVDLNFKRSFSEMTVEEMRETVSAVKRLEHNGRLKGKLIAKGKARSAANVRNRVIVRMLKSAEAQGLLKEGPGHVMGPSERKKGFWGELQETYDKGKRHIQKAEFIVREMDNWSEDSDVYNEVFLPVVEGEDKTSLVYEEIGSKIIADFRAMGSSWKSQVVNDQIPNLFTREECVVIALNSGNEGNRNAVLQGYKFSEPQLQSILDKLTQAEWDFVKKTWDNLELYYPYLNQIHKKLTGETLEKVGSIKVQTPYGEIEGGYFPLIFDKDLDFRVEQFTAEELHKQVFGTIYTKPKPRDSFVKKRVGGKMPPLLSFNVLFKHMMDVSHYIGYAVPVRDVHSILNSQDVEATIKDTFGKAAHRELKRWLQDVANPRRQPYDGFEAMIGKLRRNATVVMLGYKVTVAAKQFLSFTQTIDEIGLSEAVNGLARVYAPDGWVSIERSRDVFNFVRERSVYIRNRIHAIDREIIDVYGAMNGDIWSKSKLVKDSFFGMIRIMDMAAVMPTWVGAYDVGIEKFKGDEFKAAQYADGVVRRTQPTAGLKDLAGIQRGGELKKTFTMFYTFFNVFANRLMQRNSQFAAKIRTGEVKGHDVLNIFMSYVWMVMVPASAAWMINERRIPEPEELGLAMVSYTTGGIPFVRDMVNAAITGFDYSVSPAYEGPKTFVETVRGIDDPSWYKAKKAFDLVGYIWGIPTKQIGITVEGTADLITGETQNPLRLFFPERRRKKKKNKINW
jgi:hypothetical protein